jgi:PHD/YefM family antitoxin component YafN of YafNO toxin-antitoxin module
MGLLKVGIREFRENLANYLLQSDKPVAITRHGDTVGYYLPARRKRSDAERAQLKEAAARLQEMLLGEGITEDEIIADFKRWRAHPSTKMDKYCAPRPAHAEPKSRWDTK